MKIPKELYNPDLPDQSLESYIESYSDSHALISELVLFGVPLPGFTNDDMIKALEVTLRLEIMFRMCKIYEDHCADETEIVVNVTDEPNSEEDSSSYSLMA